jgi:AhpD family alkylhydroperoxidase
MHSALLWARSPKLFLGVAFLYGMFDRTSSPINPVLRSLVTVRVSQLNGCRFCVELNSATLLQRGVDLEKVNALDAWRQSTLFGDIERIALEYAEEVTLRSDAIDEGLIEQLRSYFETTPSLNSRASSHFKICRASSTVHLAYPRRDSAEFTSDNS